MRCKSSSKSVINGIESFAGGLAKLRAPGVPQISPQGFKVGINARRGLEPFEDGNIYRDCAGGYLPERGVLIASRGVL